MTKSQLFIKAHALTKATLQSGDSYQVTFGACLKALNATNTRLITVSALERNARRNGVATLNGVAVALNGLNLNGSDKQVAWATQIAESAVREYAAEYLRRISKNNLFMGEALDSAIDKINADLNSLSSKLIGSKAATWIDGRHRGYKVIGTVANAK